MRKIVLCLLIIVLFLGFVGADVIISEVSVRGSEYIEIYNANNNLLNLSDWQISDNSATDEITCEGIENCSIITNESYFLIIENDINVSDITSEQIIYFYVDDGIIGNRLADSIDNISFFNASFSTNFNWTSSTSGKTWQYCTSGWMENPATPGANNNCSTGGSGSDSDPSPSLTIELDWDEEDIINGEEFYITIKAENLDENENYDVMVWIENSDDDTISERYGNYSKGEIKWADGGKWAYNFLEEGDESEKIKIRIDEDYRDFKGTATIYVKFREFDDGTDIIDEWDDPIKILEAEASDDEDDDEEEDVTTSSIATTTTTGNSIIKLGSSSSSSDKESKEINEKKKNSIIYKSKNEYIKEWSVYMFGFICIGIIVLLLIDKKGLI